MQESELVLLLLYSVCLGSILHQQRYVKNGDFYAVSIWYTVPHYAGGPLTGKHKLGV